MARKLIREIFGHPGVPAACRLYICPEHKSPLAVFVPMGQYVKIGALMLGPKVREATAEEYADMHTWYKARMRIDHQLSSYTEVDPMMVSEHLTFGEFSTDSEPPSSNK